MLDHILLVCIGNICRSPMAEALLKSRLSSTHPKTTVSSAGIHAMIDHPADAIANTLMAERGLDISSHRARQASADILFSSDLILTMSTEQSIQLETMHPAIRGRVHRLGKWDESDIVDPYRRPRPVFEQALILIEQGIDAWCRILWKN